MIPCPSCDAVVPLDDSHHLDQTCPFCSENLFGRSERRLRQAVPLVGVAFGLLVVKVGWVEHLRAGDQLLLIRSLHDSTGLVPWAGVVSWVFGLVGFHLATSPGWEGESMACGLAGVASLVALAQQRLPEATPPFSWIAEEGGVHSFLVRPNLWSFLAVASLAGLIALAALQSLRRQARLEALA